MRVAFLKKPLDLKVIQGATAEWRALPEVYQPRPGSQTVGLGGGEGPVEIPRRRAARISI